MNNIYAQLNNVTGDKYRDIRLAKITLERNRATVTVVCSDESFLRVQTEEAELAKSLSGICKLNMPMFVNVVKENTEPSSVRDLIIRFAQKFPYVSTDGIAVAGDEVHIKMHDSMHQLAKDDFLPRLAEFLENSYVSAFKVIVDKIEFAAPVEPTKIIVPKKTSYKVTNVSAVLGAQDACEAVASAVENEIPSAAGVSGNNDNITVCGVLAMPTEFLSKGGGGKRPRKYEKFLLVDGEHTLQCRFFPSGENSVIGLNLIGKTVCAFGNTQVERGRTGECTLTARALATCDIPDIEQSKSRPVPREYVTVKPEPYNEYVQASLFQEADALPDMLRGEFVAFDFETTGLSVLYDKPTELGAVKIVDGVISETFHTLIDPLRPIPEEVSKKTGITDDMVKGQPTFDKVLPDFYKFTHGCRLIGHNIAFDFPFLVKHGNKAGWNFTDRATFDTMGMAPKALPGIDVLTLDNVLSLLSLVNDNAHRALSDATATAKAFIAMCKRINN